MILSKRQFWILTFSLVQSSTGPVGLVPRFESFGVTVMTAVCWRVRLGIFFDTSGTSRKEFLHFIGYLFLLTRNFQTIFNVPNVANTICVRQVLEKFVVSAFLLVLNKCQIKVTSDSQKSFCIDLFYLFSNSIRLSFLKNIVTLISPGTEIFNQDSNHRKGVR
jgi:hypothetical protein